MARINLLPWREELRKEKTNQFAAMMGISVFVIIAAVGLVYLNIAGLIDHQNYRNTILNNEIKRLDEALAEIRGLEETKQKLLSRMEVIQSLQQQRPQIVHLFDEIVRTVPEGIYLEKIRQVGGNLTIQGVAESNGRVSAYMRNIGASEWMAIPTLKVIETKKGTLRSSVFEITTSQSAPKEGDKEEG